MLMLHVRQPASQLAGETSAAVMNASVPVAAKVAEAVAVSAAASVEVLAGQLLAALPGTSVLAQEPGVLLLRVPLGFGPAASQQLRRSLRRQQQQEQGCLAGLLRVVEACGHSAGVLHYCLSYDSLEMELVQLCGLHNSALPADLDADG
jgi:hypothetical protein